MLGSVIDTQAEAMCCTDTKYDQCSGVTFPVSPPMATFTGFGYATCKPHDETLPATLNSMSQGALLNIHVPLAVTPLLNLYEAPHAHTIAPREKICPSRAAQDLRDGEIADMLSTSSRTVLSHLGNVHRKLEEDNRAQMIARAMALKIIGI